MLDPLWPIGLTQVFQSDEKLRIVWSLQGLEEVRNARLLERRIHQVVRVRAEDRAALPGVASNL